MTIETWLIIALVFSVATNIFLVWFSRLQSVKLTYVATNIGDLIDMLVGYREHLRKVYGMEMFYGEPVLQGMIEHMGNV